MQDQHEEASGNTGLDKLEEAEQEGEEQGRADEDNDGTKHASATDGLRSGKENLKAQGRIGTIPKELKAAQAEVSSHETEKVNNQRMRATALQGELDNLRQQEKVHTDIYIYCGSLLHAMCAMVNYLSLNIQEFTPKF